MAKRQPQHECNESDDRNLQIPIQVSKRRYGNSNQAETLRATVESCLVPLLRKVVREEAQPILQRYQCPGCRTTFNQTERFGARAFQLCFMNTLPRTVFTLSKITAEDGGPLKLALRDATSDQYPIVTDGPLSSMKIEICALNGEFGSDGNEDWTAEQFNGSILRERESKGLLLIGDRIVTLKNGVGFAPKLVFTDNSSWMRSRNFRLGAKPVSDEANVREGRSEPFVVKDNRGESYKKHDHPSLDDPVWRLRKIAKHGKIHMQLSGNGIETVQDLLLLYKTNPTLLEQILGNTPKKCRETIIGHAKGCVDDGRRYMYNAAEQSMILLFNSIYDVVGVSFQGQNFCPLESLDSEHKRWVETVVKEHAYRNVKDIIPAEEASQQSLVKPSAGLQDAGQSSYSDDQLLQDPLDFSVVQQASAGGELSSGVHVAGNSGALSTSQIQLFNCLSPACALPWEQLGDHGVYFASAGNGADPYDQSQPASFSNCAVDVSSCRLKRKTMWHKIRTLLKWVGLYVAKRKQIKFGSCSYKH